MKPRLAVFTARIGDKTDHLKDPAVIAPDVEYLCASDRFVSSRVWRWIPVQAGQEPIRAARLFKILGCQDATEAGAYLWLDAAYCLQVDPAVLLEQPENLLVLPHPDRQSISDEARAIAARGFAPLDVLDRQVAEYLADGYPDRALSSTGFLFRRRDDRTRAFNERWARELERHGHTRDQMSFDYSAWKCGMSIGFLAGHYRANRYAQWFKQR